MYKLASKIGKVEEIAYDPKVSHKTEYVREKITFNTESPALDAKNLILPSDETVMIQFEYEKVHKKCFHCFRLTHEKAVCPYIRRRNQEPRGKERSTALVPLHHESHLCLEGETSSRAEPPGFPVLFPELPEEDRRMAIQYVSHADETERMARIQRVKQSIEESKQESSARPMKINHDLDKGKGHVFSYDEESSRLQRRSIHGDKPIIYAPVHSLPKEHSDDNSLQLSCNSRPLVNSTTWGTGDQSSSPGVGKSGKKARRRPPAWQRRSRITTSDSKTQADSSSQEGSTKSKAENLASQGNRV
ncbi:hypothetical protein Bca101_067679 [Brassica carinata]